MRCRNQLTKRAIISLRAHSASQRTKSHTIIYQISSHLIRAQYVVQHRRFILVFLPSFLLSHVDTRRIIFSLQKIRMFPIRLSVFRLVYDHPRLVKASFIQHNVQTTGLSIHKRIPYYKIVQSSRRISKKIVKQTYFVYEE